MRLYGANELGRVPWPDTPEGRFARAYLTPLLERGSEAFVSDRTALRLVAFDGLIVPLAVNDDEYDNSPLLSNYARYVRVPLASIGPDGPGGPAAAGLARGALRGLGAALKAARIDRCVYVDHWLALRNAGAMLSDGQAGRLTAFLVERFPDHALVFAALSAATYAPLLGSLRRQGYASVYAFHTRLLLPQAAVGRPARENRRRDARLLEAAGYRVVDGRDVPGCAPRLAELYRSLNEEKYGAGLRVSPAFFEAALRDETLCFRLATKGGRVDGFFAYAVGHDVLFAPAFGYDVSLPQELGLYRGLVHRLMQEASDLGVAVELGAGADRFKRLRGDLPVPRYSAVYARHLPRFRRAGWRLLEGLANGPLRAASRAQIRAVDGDDAVGFDGPPSAYVAPGPSPREAAAALRGELDSIAAALGRAAGLEGDALAGALAPLAERLHNWPQPPRRAVALREELARLERRGRRAGGARAEAAADGPTEGEAQRLHEGAERQGDAWLIAGHLGEASAARLRALVDELRQRADCGAVALTAAREGKVALVAAVTPALLRRGLDAGQLMAQLAPAVGGKGGGAPEIAWGGGARPEGVEAALEAARRYFRARLGEAPATARPPPPTPEP